MPQQEKLTAWEGYTVSKKLSPSMRLISSIFYISVIADNRIGKIWVIGQKERSYVTKRVKNVELEGTSGPHVMSQCNRHPEHSVSLAPKIGFMSHDFIF